MKPLLCALTVAAVLGSAAPAPAGCGWFGTQVECDVGGKLLTLGTQQASEGACPGILTLQGCEGVPGMSTVPERPVAFQLQNVGVDPTLCRRVGNEAYCY